MSNDRRGLARHANVRRDHAQVLQAGDLVDEREFLPCGDLEELLRKDPESPSVDRPAMDRLPLAKPQSAQESRETSRHGVEQHMVSILAPSSFEAEQYRALRLVLEERHKTDALTIFAVSSATPGDGKTTTAINLAAALAQDPETLVLLAEVDIRRPSLATYLGLGHATGPVLVDAIQNPGLALKNLTQWHTRFNFSILLAGKPPDAPYEVLKSPRLKQVLEEARRQYDYVVLDTPPAVPIPDCRILAKLVDGFLMVVAAHKTPRKLLAEALNAMDPEKLIGLVFNNDDRPFGGYYRYYHSVYGQSPQR